MPRSKEKTTIARSFSFLRSTGLQRRQIHSHSLQYLASYRTLVRRKPPQRRQRNMEHMRYRKLGRTNLELSEIGYGAWGIGGKQWLGGEDQASLQALHRSFELGLNLIDTALAYGDGHSEQLVGHVIRSAPHRIYVASKIPPKNRIWPASPSTSISDVFPPDYIVRSTEESLRNLKVEQLDLQQFHVWTDAWALMEEWRRSIEDLKSSGKIR